MVDEISEMDDPEASYRRGFQQGAFMALKAAKAAHSEKRMEELNAWVDVTLHKWRYQDQVKNLQVQPPLPPK